MWDEFDVVCGLTCLLAVKLMWGFFFPTLFQLLRTHHLKQLMSQLHPLEIKLFNKKKLTVSLYSFPAVKNMLCVRNLFNFGADDVWIFVTGCGVTCMWNTSVLWLLQVQIKLWDSKAFPLRRLWFALQMPLVCVALCILSRGGLSQKHLSPKNSQTESNKLYFHSDDEINDNKAELAKLKI